MFKQTVIFLLLTISLPSFSQNFAGLDFSKVHGSYNVLGEYSLIGEGNSTDCHPTLYVSVPTGHPPQFYDMNDPDKIADLTPVTKLLIDPSNKYQTGYEEISFYRPNQPTYALATVWGRKLSSRIMPTGTVSYVATIYIFNDFLTQDDEGNLILTQRMTQKDVVATYPTRLFGTATRKVIFKPSSGLMSIDTENQMREKHCTYTQKQPAL